MQEGFEIYWFRSSEKARRDWNEREDKVAAAMDQLRMLADPERKNRPESENAVRRKVDLILSNVEDWIKVDITLKEVEKFQQLKHGRSSSKTTRCRTVHKVPAIHYARDKNAISQSAAMDGSFPLVTNTSLECSAALRAYKYQHKLEKRHALLKSGLAVAPIFLKKNQCIEALMFAYFLAQLVSALIERQMRNVMRERGIPQIQILPEERPSATPATEQMARVFSPCTRRLLFTEKGELLQTFPLPLTPLQKQILSLLSISPRLYD